MKEKNNEIYENFETDDNQEKDKDKKKKSKLKLAKPLIIFLVLLLIFVGFICYKYFHRSSNSLNRALLEKYNELGKKDENLQLFFLTEHFLVRRKSKYLNMRVTFHFNKGDIDKDRLLRTIKTVVENIGVFQSIFFYKDGQLHIKFDKNIYPEIIQKTLNESDYQKYIEEVEQAIDFPLNNLMYKFYIIETEKSLYFTLFSHHSITDKLSADALLDTLNRAYMNDNATPFKCEDFFYASLYEYNLKIRNDRKFINYVKNYFLNNYDLGRTFKGYREDKDIQKPVKNTMTFYIEKSPKELRDKIVSIYNGKFSRISMFNLMCQLYTLYLYNNMEDHIPEVTYVRHGRNLKFYKYSMGSFIENAFINYDFSKYTIKKDGKNYINVQEFYDNVKKQFDEQKFLDKYIKTFGYFDSNNLDNIVTSQSYQIDEIDPKTMHANLLPKYLFGKKLQENTKNKVIAVLKSNENPFAKFFFHNIYTPFGIINQIQGQGESYKVETFKKICGLFFKVAEILSDGILSDDKLVEIKMLDY